MNHYITNPRAPMSRPIYSDCITFTEPRAVNQWFNSQCVKIPTHSWSPIANNVNSSLECRQLCSENSREAKIARGATAPFALIQGSSCFCRAEATGISRASASECTTPCDSGSGERCGGPDVYYTKATIFGSSFCLSLHPEHFPTGYVHL